MINHKIVFKDLISKDKNLIYVLDDSKKCPFFKKPIIKEEILFYELAQSIVGQQISAKAASAIWKRLVSVSKDKKLFLSYMSKSKTHWARKQGLSQRKHDYIKHIAIEVLKKNFSLKSINNLDDHMIIKILTSYKGIGPWTSQMFLMFALKRLDIFSISDIALRRAISEIYGIDQNNFKKIKYISDKWKPYRSIVCWYLWEYLGV